MLSKCTKYGDVAVELLLFIRENPPSCKEKFGAQQTNALSTKFGGSSRTLEIAYVGKDLHSRAISSRTWLVAPEYLILYPPQVTFLLLLAHQGSQLSLLSCIQLKEQ